MTPRQQAFVEAYLECWNGAEAARRAGYSKTRAHVEANELLHRHPKVRAAIDDRLAQYHLSANEVLARLSEQAAASMEDFLDERGHIDLTRARARGRMHLIRKYSVDAQGKKTLELIDPQAALEKLGKYYRLFVERVEQSGPNGAPMETRITEVVVELPRTATE